MDIGDVAGRLNEMASDFRIGNLQPIRQKLKGLNRVPSRTIFAPSTIKRDQWYAFHNGGLQELQFNIGFEDGNLFRYGVAFSLKASRNLPDPVSVLQPKIHRFNSFVSKHDGELSKLKFWYFADNERSQTGNLRTISQEMIRPGVFIFVGRFFTKSLERLTEADYRSILTTFDELLPLYEHVEGARTEERVARLCWNTNEWRSPSGPAGKSPNKDVYENKYGYGHEEWLLDMSRLVDGVHYGFLQGAHHNRAKLEGSLTTLHLYTINSDTKERYWIGRIIDAEVISEEESRKIWLVYKKSGWNDEMAAQLGSVGLDAESIRTARPERFFNLKFRTNDLDILADRVQFGADDSAVTSTYYTTLPHFSGPPSALKISSEFQFVAGHTERVLRSSRSTKKNSGEIDLAHNRMQTAIYAQLREEYGEKCVGTENSAGLGSKIDVVLKSKTSHVFFEIKTSNSLKACIREAIGQLLEYGYWSGKEPAEKFIIVSHNSINDEASRFLQLVRKKFGVPIYYRQFSVETQRLERAEF